MKAISGISSLIACAVIGSTAHATTYYSDAARPDDAGAGTSWATAKKTIQAAVDLALDGDTVLVTNGVYSTGGRVTPGSTASTTSRVVIAKAIMVRSVNGPDATIIQGWGPNGQCGTGAVRGVYLTNATLVGFTITNGFTHRDGDYYVDQSGGGVFLENGGLVLNCVMSGNSANHGGGGVFLDYGGLVSNCALSGNNALRGGGAFCYYGGTVQNCLFSGNSAGASGGGVYCYNGGTVQNCTLSGNSTLSAYSMQGGGGAFCDYGGTLENCVLTGNNSYYAGGGAYCYYGGTLENCVLTGNSADNGGGARCDGADGAVPLRNCTIVSNIATRFGGGVHGYRIILINCIVCFNIASSSSNYNGVSLLWSCSTPLPPGTGNISNDPQFVDVTADDFRLKSFSPCINAGTNLPGMQLQTDLDGWPRILEGRVDMGAYENTQYYGHVDVTTTPFSVSYDVANCTIAGTNTSYIVGRMVWTNVLTGATGSFAAAVSWAINGVGLGVGDNLVTVSGTNVYGDAASDSVAITRGGAGAPWLDITNATMTVGFKTVSTSLGGTNNIHIVGRMWWTNGLNGMAGSFTNYNLQFTITNIALAVGTNTIVVYGSNVWNIVTNDQISIMRLDEASSGPLVTNVYLAQRLQTKLMDIRYDLADPDDTNLAVTIAISTNAGASFDLVPSSAWDGGAVKSIGQGVQPGTNKWIVWNAGVDWNNRFTTQMAVRVTASDGSTVPGPVPAGMALIPAGAFSMGDTFSEGHSDELPMHTVMVSAVYMDKYEVTYTLWISVYQWATNHGYSFDYAGSGKATNHPVQTVNWYDCVKWCNARSEMEGLVPCYYTNAAQTLVYRGGQADLSNEWVKWSANGYRLPTDAEWEKAARGGLSGRRFPWYDLNITHTNANYYSLTSYSYDTSTTRGYHPTFATGGTPYTSPCGYFAPYGYGLYDMAGNVWEWCWDQHGSTYYSISPTSDPRGPATGKYRVPRGGCWDNDANYTRCARREFYYYVGGLDPVLASSAVGFRCARGLDSSLYPSAVSPPALCETRDPVVVITNAPPSLVSYDLTALTIAGTNGPAIVGGVWWSNSLTAASGVFTNYDLQFTIYDVALSVGTNVISVYGTNVVEIQTNASVTIVRGQDDLPPVIAPDALVFPGTNGGVLEAGVATAIVWRVAGIWDNADGTNLLLPSIAILTTNNGAVVMQPGTNVPNMAGRLAWTPWGMESETTAYVVRIEAVDSAGNRTNRIFSRNVFTVVPESGVVGMLVLLTISDLRLLVGVPQAAGTIRRRRQGTKKILD